MSTYLFNSCIFCLLSKSNLDLPRDQHGMEARLYLEDAPPSFSDKLWGQNDDETSALIHASSQVFNVGWERQTKRTKLNYKKRAIGKCLECLLNIKSGDVIKKICPEFEHAFSKFGGNTPPHRLLTQLAMQLVALQLIGLCLDWDP